MSETSTIPSTVHMASTDVLPLDCDATALLIGSELVASVTTSLTNLTTKAAVTLSDAPTVDAGATGATQIVRGSELAAGTSYRLAYVLTLTSGTVLTQGVVLTVDF